MHADIAFKSVMVTGASGYVGRAVAAGFAALGCEVLVPVRPGRNVPAFANLRSIDLPSGSLADVPDLLSIFKPELLVHCAAYGVQPGDRDPVAMFEVNTKATIDLGIAATRHCRALILTGSVSEYALGGTPCPLREDSPLETQRIYGASKAAGVVSGLAIAANAGLPALALRLFNVFGPGEAPHRLIPSLTSRLRRGERVALSPGGQLRDFVFIDDIVDAYIAAAARLCAGAVNGALNICTGRPVCVRDLATRVAARYGCDTSLLGFGDLAYRPDDVMEVYGAPEAAATEMGWRAKRTIDDAIDTIYRRDTAL